MTVFAEVAGLVGRRRYDRGDPSAALVGLVTEAGVGLVGDHRLPKAARSPPGIRMPATSGGDIGEPCDDD